MAQKYTVKDSELKGIANAIRSKTGNDEPLTFPSEFVAEIGTLSKPSGTVYITANGNVNVTDYQTANVSVPVPTPRYQDKIGITPTESSQAIVADEGYDALNSVQIDPIDSDYVGSAIERRDSTDLTASDATVTVPAGYYENAGSKSVTSGSATTPATTITVSPSISVNASGLITASASGTKSVTPSVSPGYISSGTAGTVTVSGSNTKQLTTQGATTITPTTSSQTAVASGTYTTGAVTVDPIPPEYIVPSGNITLSQNEVGVDVAQYATATVSVPAPTPNLQTKSKTYTPTTSQQTDTVTADAGYDGLDEVDVTINAVPVGSATTPATTITANPSISVNSSGLITATNSKTQSITPTVSEGYVSSGTAGTVTVSGSNTSQLSTQSGTTITPTESEQTAVASGKYTTGVVKVGAISSTYVGSGITRRDDTDLSASGATVTVPSGFYEETETKSVSSGTAGTPTATKSAVSNHSVTVTPSVTNTTGYISGGTKTGTAVTVSASELVSGSQTITENDTYDVTNLSTIVVNVSGGGGGGVVVTDTTDVHGGTIREITATVIEGSQTITQNGTYDVTSLESVTVSVSGGGGSDDLKGVIERTATTPTLPSDLTKVGDYAFYNCENLALTSLPSGVTSIGNSAFSGCSNIALTSLPSGVTKIGTYAFRDCTKLALTSLPSGITSIETYTFYNCTSLALTSLPSGVTSIGTYAFRGCTNLALTSLPSGISNNSIASDAFRDCTSLALTSLPSNITSIGTDGFYNCSSMTLSSLPSGMVSIGQYGFYHCTNITISSLPSGLTTLSNYAFQGCTSITISSVPSGIKTINQYVFAGCTNIRTFTFHDAITSIGAHSFNGCTGLEELHFQRATPPTVASTSFVNLPTTCTIYVPTGSLSAYTTASNYPSSATYTYVEE